VSHILSFSDEMRLRGHEPSLRVVDRGERSATGDEEQRLGTTDVFVLRRVREADHTPVALETAMFPTARVAGVLDGELEGASIFALLEAAGIVPTAGRAAISAEAATAEDAKLLGVKRGEPLLVERRLNRNQDGGPLEITASRYVGARDGLDVDFEMELPG
jgi:GntR family transcriptional regulator